MAAQPTQQPTQQPPAAKRSESPLDRMRRLKMEALRNIPPVEVVTQLFPNFEVEEEAQGRSWKVRMPEGHLHIDGPVFNLLEDSKNKKWRGGGAIDAYVIMSGKSRDDRLAFQQAVKALTAKFIPWTEDPNIPFSEKLKRLENTVVEMTAATDKTKNRRAAGPVDLPDKSPDQKDWDAAGNYLVEKRGLPDAFVREAMDADAVYAARMESSTPGRRGPLNLIFPLVEYRTGKVVSYSRRSVFGDTKKNKGAKMTAGYIMGDFREASVLFVTESPIEAQSRYVLLKQQLPDKSLLKSCCVVGVNGSGRQTELLAVAKQLGYQHVFGGYNNDHSGRAFNAQLMEDAKAAGIASSPDVVPGGEVLMSVFPHDRTKAAHERIKKLLLSKGIPNHELDKTTRENRQFPNTVETTNLIGEIEKERIGYHSIDGKNEPSLIAARDELVMEAKGAGKSLLLRENKDSGDWKVSVLRDQETESLVNVWKNRHSKNPVVAKDPKALIVDFHRLISFDYICKDWNDLLKERNAITQGRTEGVLGRRFNESIEPTPVFVATISQARDAKKQLRSAPTKDHVASPAHEETEVDSPAI